MTVTGNVRLKCDTCKKLGPWFLSVLSDDNETLLAARVACGHHKKRSIKELKKMINPDDPDSVPDEKIRVMKIFGVINKKMSKKKKKKKKK